MMSTFLRIASSAIDGSNKPEFCSAKSLILAVAD